VDFGSPLDWWSRSGGKKRSDSSTWAGATRPAPPSTTSRSCPSVTTAPASTSTSALPAPRILRLSKGFSVPPPPQWYGLLTDITYTWRVRTSSASSFVALDDASWSPFAERRFKTPAVSSATITAVSPAGGSTVSSRTRTLQWADPRLLLPPRPTATPCPPPSPWSRAPRTSGWSARGCRVMGRRSGGRRCSGSVRGRRALTRIPAAFITYKLY